MMKTAVPLGKAKYILAQFSDTLWEYKVGPVIKFKNMEYNITFAW